MLRVLETGTLGWTFKIGFRQLQNISNKFSFNKRQGLLQRLVKEQLQWQKAWEAYLDEGRQLGKPQRFQGVLRLLPLEIRELLKKKLRKSGKRTVACPNAQSRFSRRYSEFLNFVIFFRQFQSWIMLIRDWNWRFKNPVYFKNPMGALILLPNRPPTCPTNSSKSRDIG